MPTQQADPENLRLAPRASVDDWRSEGETRLKEKGRRDERAATERV
jgi:hypothetical protein